jgi:hypothetical protein
MKAPYRSKVNCCVSTGARDNPSEIRCRPGAIRRLHCGADECAVESAPTLPPFAIPRCSSLQIPKNAPCSLIRENSFNILKPFRDFTDNDRLSLQFLKISLQIAKCRENRPRDLFASDCILSHAVWSLWGLRNYAQQRPGSEYRPAAHTGPQKKPRVVAGLEVGGNRPGREVPIDDRPLTPSSPLRCDGDHSLAKACAKRGKQLEVRDG